MKDLIITLAIDIPPRQGHRLQTALLKASAREFGYEGDFLTIHNCQRADGFYLDGAVFPKAGENDLEVFHDPKIGRNRHRTQNLKVHLDEIVDFTKWDRVMFCDTDVLFFENPILLFNASEVDLSFAREKRRITDGPFHSCWSDDQMKAFRESGDKGINSGQFVVRNGRAKRLWEVWRETLATEWHRNSKVQDQSPFNHLVYFSEEFSTEEFPQGWVKFPYQSKKPSHHWDAKLIHYCGWAGVGKMRLAFSEFVRATLVKKGQYEFLARTLLGLLK